MKFKYFLSISIMALLLIFVVSCSKDQISELPQEETSFAPFVYKISIVDNEVETEKISAEHIAEYLQNQKEAGTEIDFRNNNHHASGLVTNGESMANFNAVSNNGGVHGNTHLSGPTFWIDLKFDSECLLVLDNKAYWGGTVTTYEVSEELQGLPFGIGWQFFWSAIDEGEGSQSDPDLIGDALIVIPPGLIATDYGFATWCDYADFDYNLLDESIPHYPHNHYPGDNPTNIQID